MHTVTRTESRHVYLPMWGVMQCCVLLERTVSAHPDAAMLQQSLLLLLLLPQDCLTTALTCQLGPFAAADIEVQELQMVGQTSYRKHGRVFDTMQEWKQQSSQFTP